MPTAMLKTATIGLIFSAIGIGIVFWWIAEPEDFFLFFEIEIIAWIFSLTVLLLSYFLGALRIQYLVSLLGKDASFLESLKAYLLGLFSGAVTPGSSGRDPAIALSLIHSGLSKEESWSIAIYTSVLDMLLFAWSVPFAIMTLYFMTEVRPDPILLGLAMLVSLICLFLWYLLTRQMGWVKWLSQKFFSIFWLNRWREPAFEFMNKFGHMTEIMSKSGLRSQSYLQLLTLGSYLATYFIFFIVASSLGGDVGVLSTLAILLVLTAVSNIVPTPGGSGYMELAVAYVFAKGVDSGVVGPTVVAWRTLTHYIHFVIGPFLAGDLIQNRRKPKESLINRE